MNEFEIRMRTFVFVVVGLALPAAPAAALGLDCFFHEEDVFQTHSSYEVSVTLVGFDAISSSGRVFAASSSLAMGDSSWRNLDTQIGGECSNLELTLQSDSDVSTDLYDYSVDVWAESSLLEECSDTSAATIGAAGVFFGFSRAFAQSELYERNRSSQSGWPDGTVRAWDNKNGFTTSHSRSEAPSSYSFHTSPELVIIDQRIIRNATSYSVDCDGVYDYVVGSMDYRSTTFVRFGSVKLDWQMADGTRRVTSIQGVMAEAVDGEEYRPICLGTLPLQGEPCGLQQDIDSSQQFEISPPIGNVVGVDITCVVDMFIGFDGDINGDGQVCADDEALILDLIDQDAAIEIGNYIARADFNLDGVINLLDLEDFLLIYQDLPDCNSNSKPDACDIADGTSMDLNENGIPDECEAPASGACCLGDLGCEIMTEPWCIKQGGVYNGDGSSCGGLLICSRGGACCMPDGGCLMLSEVTCGIMQGDWDGDSSCRTKICSTPLIERRKLPRKP